jgi:predicted DNA-binding WGR domain protein
VSSGPLSMRFSGTVCIGLEPTGDFHRTIAYRLVAEGFQVVSISSLALSRFREARFGNWDKNDPKDAQVMLAMMAQGFVQVYWDPLFSGAHDWQELSNTYFQLTLARTRLQHSLLSHHLPLYFPEFTRYWLSQHYIETQAMTAPLLYRIAPAKRMQRYYRLDVQTDLFGQWCLMREWGRIGSSGQTRSLPFSSPVEAETALDKLRRGKEQRGYSPHSHV